MNRQTADTNVLLRFLLKDNLKQYEIARQLLAKVTEGQTELIIPQIVVFESVFAFEKYYRLPKVKIIKALNTILGARNVTIQDRGAFKKALELFRVHNISFVDCFLAAYSEENDAKLFTFDKDLQKLAQK